MQIKKAEFASSLVKGYNEFNSKGIPEVAFVGRPNVGKSSLLNLIAGRKNLAFVSKKQGKTRLVNYFLINDSFYIVDLPGYGFANTSKQEMEQWNGMISEYFETSENLKGIYLLIDIRRDPSEHDVMMLDYARELGIPVSIVVTKTDKVAKTKRNTEVARIRRALKEHAPETFIQVSSELRTGKDELCDDIERYLVE